jgi:single-stranded DNA-specific DHH superfamily exonuclease
MAHFDVFNGDADGICSLHQLRLATPRDAVLVTGAKRDIALLHRVPAQAGDHVTALDISLAVNRDALEALLARGVHVEYFDHHYSGPPLAHPRLDAVLDPSPDVCTGILVDRHLGGRFRAWAVVAAFGDNLLQPAAALAASRDLAGADVQRLHKLGDLLAYNAYGDDVADLVVPPQAMYRALHGYDDPLRFLDDHPEPLRRIAAQRGDDLAQAAARAPDRLAGNASVHVLPDAAWSRRVRGVLANDLANRDPDRAHAVLTPNAQGGYTASVRAPRARDTGADVLCRAFATGGGRAAAAGIDHLPREALPAFVQALERAFP